VLNFLTIDVEDYFQVHAFAKVIDPADWDKYPCRVEKNTELILDLLEQGGPSRRPVKATFFILGWIARRYPHLVRAISDAGHEIASHGYSHKVIYHQTRDEFREDVRRSKTILEDLTGKEVYGYRAPTYSITERTLWALSVLKEEGYRYDSSVFPIRHDYYGMPRCPRFPFFWDLNGQTPGIGKMFPGPMSLQAGDLSPAPPQGPHAAGENGHLVEFPLSTVTIFGKRFPVAGGGYFRLFPLSLTMLGLRRINKEGRPFIFYVHPWEMDPGIPVIKGASFLSRFRTYVNLGKTRSRFKQLLSRFSFTPLRTYFDESQ